jgi:hypothetical protein
VGSCEDGVHSTAGSDDSGIRASATEIGDHNELISNSSLGSSVVGESSSNRLVDELENLKAGLLGRSSEGLALGVGEIGRDGNDSGVDLLAKVIGGRLLQAAKVTGSDLGDSNSVGGIALSVTDGESNG